MRTRGAISQTRRAVSCKDYHLAQIYLDEKDADITARFFPRFHLAEVVKFQCQLFELFEDEQLSKNLIRSIAITKFLCCSRKLQHGNWKAST